MPLPIAGKNRARPSRLTPWALNAGALALPMAAMLASSTAVAADPAPFELNGPGLRIQVTRGKETLPIAQVPSLAEGDMLSIHADLPEDQGAKFLMVSAFLRGATNPPPKDWIKIAETWRDKEKNKALALTVPKNARQMVMFLVPDTGGAEGTLVDAVRGKPGEFVRATQDLNQASLDHSRLDAFMAAIRAQDNYHPEFLRSVAPTLARSLSMKLNEECLSKVIELQASCLLENRETLVLADVHTSSVAETLTGAPTDLALQLSATREAGYGYYSAYIGVARDIAKIFGAFSNPQFSYLPTLSVRKGDRTGLLLNTAPSFEKPKSVMVIAMPAIESGSPPRLRTSANDPVCAVQAGGAQGTLLPVEGAPLIYSTAYPREMKVTLTAPSGQTVDVPLEARADRGGYVLAGGELPAAFTGTLRAHVYGYWGFDRFEGPDFLLQKPDGGGWQVAGGDKNAEMPTLVVGRDNPLVLTGAAPSCVESVTLRQGGSAQSVEWKVQGKDGLALTLPLAGRKPGEMSVEVKVRGTAQPSTIALRADVQASRVDGLVIHAGDDWGVLTGQRLDQVDSAELAGLTLKPDGLTRDGTVDRLRLARSDGQKLPEGASQTVPEIPGDAAARIRLRGGRTVSVPITLAEARPRVNLLSKTIEPGPVAAGGRVLGLPGEDLLPDNGRMVFSVRSDAAPLTPADVIEVAPASGGEPVRLSAGKGLKVAGPQVLVASFDPETLPPSTFGPLRFRLVRGGDAGDWQPLVTLARLPHIDGVSCGGAERDANCTIRGSDLFLIDAVGLSPALDPAVNVAQGFTGSALQVPAARDGKFYLRLRDAPGAPVVLPVS